jgi:hypothetical protein
MTHLERIRDKGFEVSLALNITPPEKLTDIQRKYIQDNRASILTECIAEWILGQNREVTDESTGTQNAE